MRTFTQVTLNVILIAVLAFLLLPIVIIVLVSFSNSAIFDLPSNVGALSLRWYLRLGSLESFWSAVSTSLVVAIASTTVSLVIGVPAAIAVTRGQFPGRQAVLTFLLAPLTLPGLVLGIALLQSLRGVGVRDALASLFLAHVVITLPFIVRSVSAALVLFDFALIDAAQTLGRSYAQSVIRVLIPNIAPAILTGGLFAFIASFDNYSVSLFLSDVRTKTIPVQMLTYLEQSPDPSIAAISSILILITIAVLMVGQRMVGLNRLISF